MVAINRIAAEKPAKPVSTEDQIKAAQKQYRALMDQKKRDCIALDTTWNAVNASQEIRAEHPEVFEAMGVKSQGLYWEA